VPISGWCFHREARTKSVHLVVDGERVPMLAHSLPRPDVHGALFPDQDPVGHSYTSGFFGVLPLRGVDCAQPVEIGLEVALTRSRCERRAVDRIELVPHVDTVPSPALAGARIAICMATHNPDYDLFARQIESISDQSAGGWRCVISDDRSAPHRFDRITELLAGDDRFVLDRSPHLLGSYNNFERALALVGRDAELVALSDQDDVWHPDKLEVLEDALGDGALLAYSDCRIVRPDGELTSTTFFPKRKNNWRDLRSLVLANTVTGAATMLRRELLDDALPFPPYTPGAFHDHWLACVALSLGELAYVQRPLWDYVQHGDNLLGHAIGQRLIIDTERGEWMLHNRVVYKHLLMRTVALAQALKLRLGDRMTTEKRRAVDRIASLEHSVAASAQLVLRAAAERPQKSSTLGLERELVGGMVWRRRMSRAGGRGDKRGDMRFSSTLKPARPTAVAAEDFDGVRAMVAKMAPLQLSVAESEPTYLNILIGEVDGDRLHPEHAAAVHLAARLDASGIRTRLVAVDRGTILPSDWRTWIDRSASVALVDAQERSQGLKVSPRDVFAATSWWTARVAHAATTELGAERFLYLIRGEEPLISPPHSWATEAQAANRLPHIPLYIEDAIACYPPSHPDQLRARATRRLLFYAPPTADARSMRELGVVALERAATDGLLEGWELSAIGMEDGLRAIELVTGVELAVIKDVDPAAWRELLRAHDVGLALEASPRPSLASFEMAANGLLTVTNTYETKDADWLGAKSPNLIAAEPTGDGLLDGLRIALGRASDLDARIAGATVRWPSDWAQTFDPSLVREVAERVRARLS
jgi:Glycosyl transferase family 2